MTDYIDLSLESNNKKIKVVDNGDGTYTLATYDVNASSGTGGATNFTDLADVPSSYTGEAGSITVVNNAENALEFLAPGTDGQILTMSGTDPVWDTPVYLENGSEGQVLTISGAEPVWQTPDSLENGSEGQVLTIVSAEPAWATPVTTFLGLTDAPDSYSGKGSNLVQVNAGATGVGFLSNGSEGQTLTISGSVPAWNTPSTITNGSENQVMTIVGGVPAWATHSTVDSTAIHKATAGELNAMSEKTSLAVTDIFVIEDSADAYNKKKAQLTNLPFASSSRALLGPPVPVTSGNVAVFDGTTGLLVRDGGALTDSNAFHKTTASEFSALTEKTALDNDDILVIEDSAATNAKKKVLADKFLLNPLTTDGDLLYNGTETITTSNGSPTGDISEYQGDYQHNEFIINGCDKTVSTAYGDITVAWTYTCHTHGYNYNSNQVTLRLRRTNLAGSILWTATSSSQASDVFTYTSDTSYVDSSPTDGHYVLTCEYTDIYLTDFRSTSRVYTVSYDRSGSVRLPVGSTGQILTVSGGLPSWQTSTALHTTVAGEINGVTEKTVVSGTDLIIIEDSAATNAKKKVQLSNLITLINADGWVAAGETWTYASADDPTYTFTIAGVDLTTKYYPGIKIKLTQTTVKYFIITAVAFSTNTTITVYGGTDYDLANAAISANYYSTGKSPTGFPLDPTKWTVEVTDTNSNSQNTPGDGTWYNAGSITISIPIGVWNVTYQGCTEAYNGTAGNYDAVITLSTANNSQSDADFTAYFWGGDGKGIFGTAFREKILNLAAKTSYYLNVMNNGNTTGVAALRGDKSKTIIRAICAYL